MDRKPFLGASFLKGQMSDFSTMFRIRELQTLFAHVPYQAPNCGYRSGKRRIFRIRFANTRFRPYTSASYGVIKQEKQVFYMQYKILIIKNIEILT